MGVYTQTVDRELADVFDLSIKYGAIVNEVVKDSPADEAGIKEDDVIVAINGSKVTDSDELTDEVHEMEPGDEIVMMLPNYMLVWGLARSFGVKVVPFYLREERNWGIDIAELEGLVTDKTRMIVICNPNNPTGSVLSEVDMAEVARIADKADAYILSDEIYRGSELNGREGKSFHDVYDRTIVLSGLSKAMAHPGLRIGWIAADKQVVDDCWHCHDYTSISTGIISQYAGRLLLGPDRRQRVLNRGRNILRINLDYLTNWIAAHSDRFHLIPPSAGGMAFVRYELPINSSELTDRLRREKNVFVVPGDWYGMDHYLRFGIGCEHHVLTEGLERLGEFLSENS